MSTNNSHDASTQTARGEGQAMAGAVGPQLTEEERVDAREEQSPTIETWFPNDRSYEQSPFDEGKPDEVWEPTAGSGRSLQSLFEEGADATWENNPTRDARHPFDNGTEAIEPVSNYAQDEQFRTKPTSEPSHAPTRSVGDELLEETCPECGQDISVDESDQYCPDCGLLLTDQSIDPGPDWRAYNHQQRTNRKRTGSPMKESIHDKGLSTMICSRNTDINGNQISSRKKRQMARLRKWDKRFKVKNSHEETMKQSFGEIKRMCSEMELPEFVEETACTVYRRAQEEDLVRGRSIEAMTTASVFIAMRQAKIPKTLNTLLGYSRVDSSDVRSAYSYISQELSIEVEPPQMLDYLNRVSSELEISAETEEKAKELLELAVEEKIHSGKEPCGMAASAVYAATIITRCDRVTQAQTADAGGVCQLTVRERVRELLEIYGIDYNEVSAPKKGEAEQNQRSVAG